MRIRFLASACFALLLGAAALHHATAQDASGKEQRKSPHDTVSTSLGGKTLTITYGRPYLKGRQVFGHDLVPFGQVWRLGADEATKLTTDTDITINDLKVPKGSYSLFTIPAKDHWTLIVDKKADQWGAFSYDPAQDLGRTQLSIEPLANPVEQFTISLKPASAGAVSLSFAWEKTQASTKIHFAQ
jgi:hypothetical protein